MQEPHRSGLLKQSNKKHKSRFSSKRSLENVSKGKINFAHKSGKKNSLQKKTDRRFQATQLRNKKKDEALMKKRQIGGPSTPPFLVAVVPLGFSPITEKLLNIVIDADAEASVTCSTENVYHLAVPRWKQRFSFYLCEKGNLYATLDALKVCDSVIFLLSAKSSYIIDAPAEKMLTCLLTQGLPSPTVALLDLEDLPVQKRNSLKQDVQKVINRWLPDEKVLSLDKNGDGLMLLRRLGNQKQRIVHQRDNRSHLFGETVEMVANTDSDTCVLKVSGYLKGQNLSANQLVHIPGWGDFQMNQIDAPPDPNAFDKDDMQGYTEVLQIADPEKRTSLLAQNIPDPMDAEQTWPTADELKDAKKKILKKVPKGMSEYQACWIPEELEEDAELPNDDENEENASDVEMDSDDDDSEGNEEWEEYNDGESEIGEAEPDKYDKTVNFEEEGDMLSKLRAAREEAAFPDEVDTPQDIPARERFAKYRGLASFRTSPWDPKENLPVDYARIFQFQNFARTKKRILTEQQEQLDGVPPGGYVTVHVKDVPKHLVETRSPGQPVIIVGMLPHEHKMSVVNILVKRSCQDGFYQLPLKSKEPVIFHCGYRRYRARPIYSQHTNGSKHKYERFFQPETSCVATVYAPIVFPPASVLMFTGNGSSLVATGSVISVNPDRLIIKRVILSGHPFRVLKHSAIIRFMFFNREDILWFKPVELRTKYGRRGHIREPLGTHGHMKAVFDDQLKSQDTVMMHLFKRVFPPWSYEPSISPAPPLYKVISIIPKEKEEMES